MINEVWKDIEGYEGLYQVSSFGRVKSLSRLVNCVGGNKRQIKERILKTCINNEGYKSAHLFQSCKGKWYLISRLVAIAFLPNPQNKPEVNHMDNDTSNNRLTNLEWSTAHENDMHAAKQGRRFKKLTKEQAYKIRSEYKPGKGGFSTRKLAKKYLVSQPTVLAIVHNKIFNY